jgi:hypothetical protein
MQYDRSLPTAGVIAVKCWGLNKWRAQSAGAPHPSRLTLPVHFAGRKERLLVMGFCPKHDRSTRRLRIELRTTHERVECL